MKNLNLKKNKKGFTLVEIIVVLVIMGILLAIAVPSVMGYVRKAQDQQYIAESRNGFLGATTIVANENAKQTPVAERTVLNKDTINKEIGETDMIKSASCKVEETAKDSGIFKVTSCEIELESKGGYKVVYKANDKAEMEEGSVADFAGTTAQQYPRK